MQLPRMIRGALRTALSWAVAWAAIGGVLVVAWQWIWPSFPSAPGDGGLRWAWSFFWQGAAAFAMIGALAGGLFSVGLALSARSLTLSSLSYARMAVLGMLGGAGVVAGMGAAKLFLGGAWPAEIASSFGIAAILGGGSAWAMLRLARTGPEGQLASGEAGKAIRGSSPSVRDAGTG